MYTEVHLRELEKILRKLGKRNSRIEWNITSKAIDIVVYYHHTPIMLVHSTCTILPHTHRVTLCTGDFHTATTKRRMNEVAKALQLPFSVYQRFPLTRKHDWFVERPPSQETLPFVEGMTFFVRSV